MISVLVPPRSMPILMRIIAVLLSAMRLSYKPMSTIDLDARVELASSLARDAGALALRYFNRELAYSAESKGDAQDWVSVADRSVEALCRTRLAEAFPGDAMLGEEAGGTIGERTWIIDPIDGTLNFVHGVRYWCVSI